MPNRGQHLVAARALTVPQLHRVKRVPDPALVIGEPRYLGFQIGDLLVFQIIDPLAQKIFDPQETCGDLLFQPRDAALELGYLGHDGAGPPSLR